MKQPDKKLLVQEIKDMWKGYDVWKGYTVVTIDIIIIIKCLLSILA